MINGKVLLNMIKRLFSYLKRGGKTSSANTVSILEYNTLSDILDQADIKIVDIGARGGAMRSLNILAPFVHLIACEPDKDESAKVKEKLLQDSAWKRVTMFNDAISSVEGEANIHITQQPGLSSLLYPNYDVIRKYYKGDEFDVQSEWAVNTISLDNAAKLYEFEDACFIKVDTQGTELDILKSGADLIKNSVLGIYVEVEFHEFYKDQPLFSDVDSFLRSLGFNLFDLHRVLHRRANYQNNLYSRRQVVWAHALYLREPEDITSDDKKTGQMNITRLLGLALAFEHYDFAIELTKSSPLRLLFGDGYTEKIRNEILGYVKARTHSISNMLEFDLNDSKLTTFVYKDRTRIYRQL